MAARVLPGPGFSTAPAVELFSAPFMRDPFGYQCWDLAPNGQFVMLRAQGYARVEVLMIRNAVSVLEAAARRRLGPAI